MTSLRLLIIFSGCITLSTLGFSLQPEGFVEGSRFEECNERLIEHRDEYRNCSSWLFTPEKRQEAFQKYNSTRCFQCLYYCSIRDDLMNCGERFFESFASLSEKSRTMMPLIREFTVEAVSFICENDAEAFKVYYDDEGNNECFLEGMRACDSYINSFPDPIKAFTCDSENPENDPYTERYICQNVVASVECMAKEVKSCSSDVVDLVNTALSKVKTTRMCAKYY